MVISRAESTLEERAGVALQEMVDEYCQQNLGKPIAGRFEYEESGFWGANKRTIEYKPRCPHCGVKVDIDARLCSQCGAPV